MSAAPAIPSRTRRPPRMASSTGALWSPPGLLAAARPHGGRRAPATAGLAAAASPGGGSELLGLAAGRPLIAADTDRIYVAAVYHVTQAPA
jgi:hypothetical protein